MAAEAFTTMTAQLAREVSELQALCVLAGSDARPAAMQRLASGVDEVEDRLLALEAAVEAELALTEDARALVTELAAQSERAEELKRCLAKSATSTIENSDENDVENDTYEHNVENASTLGNLGPNSRSECGKSRYEGSEEDLQEGDDFAGEEVDNGAGATVDPETGKVSVSAPSKDQLDAVPNYMRGRLTVEKVEAAVQVVNATFEYKRSTMLIPRGKQSVTVREQIMAWRDQELEETRGLHFVSRDDIFAQAARDGIDLNIVKQALQVLRYTGALRHISGGGCARFCV